VTVVSLDQSTVVNNYRYMDESLSLRPYTTYRYRVTARTIAGVTISSWSNVTTRSASQLLSSHIDTVYVLPNDDNS